jgi:hypothetical protein
VQQVVTPPSLATTTTSLAASAMMVHRGQTVKFTAKVRAGLARGKPTGAVSFLVGNVVVARVRVNAAGKATIKHSFAAAGRFVIRAVYTGDTNFAASAQSITEQVRGAGSNRPAGGHSRAVRRQPGPDGR